MKDSFFTNENQLAEWIKAAEDIRESFGLHKAMGYLIGEKFYNTIRFVYSSRKVIKAIEEQREKADYNPSRTNLDDMHERQLKRIEMAREVLIEFADLIKKSFDPYEINQYLKSNPRFGAFGHILSEEEHEFMVNKGFIEHSLETEIEDAFIYGEMVKYLL
jgi:hypothetical protein